MLTPIMMSLGPLPFVSFNVDREPLLIQGIPMNGSSFMGCQFAFVSLLEIASSWSRSCALLSSVCRSCTTAACPGAAGGWSQLECQDKRRRPAAARPSAPSQPAGAHASADRKRSGRAAVPASSRAAPRAPRQARIKAGHEIRIRLRRLPGIQQIHGAAQLFQLRRQTHTPQHEP